jgi:hypothetical protein
MTISEAVRYAAVGGPNQVVGEVALGRWDSAVVHLHRAMVDLGRGDLAAAQAIIRAAPREVDPGDLVVYLANYWDLFWVLDEHQQELLLRLTPSAFDNDRAAWGIVNAHVYWLRGDKARAGVRLKDSPMLAG